jgi:hypothetical protein
VARQAGRDQTLASGNGVLVRVDLDRRQALDDDEEVVAGLRRAIGLVSCHLAGDNAPGVRGIGSHPFAGEWEPLRAWQVLGAFCNTCDTPLHWNPSPCRKEIAMSGRRSSVLDKKVSCTRDGR